MEKVLKDKLKGGKFRNVKAIDSKRMSAVKGRGNKSTELKLRLGLVRAGLKGWKMGPKTLRGKPDFFFQRVQLAIFVDGCFWHGCPVCGHIPKKNKKFWETKISRNQERDIQTTSALEDQGIKVIRFWEHELKENLDICINQIENLVN